MWPVTSREPSGNGRHARPEIPSGTRLPLSPEPSRQHAEASLGELVREAATHFSTLFRAEVELAKAEGGVQHRLRPDDDHGVGVRAAGLAPGTYHPKAGTHNQFRPRHRGGA